MRRALVRLLIGYLVLMALGVLYFEVDGANRLKIFLERRLTLALGTPLTIGKVGIDYLEPFTLRLQQVATQKGSISLEANQLKIRLRPHFDLPKIKPNIVIQIYRPVVEQKLESANPQLPSVATPPAVASSSNPAESLSRLNLAPPPMNVNVPQNLDFPFRFEIFGGSYQMLSKDGSIELSSIDCELASSGFHRKSNFKLKAQAIHERNLDDEKSRSVTAMEIQTEIKWNQSVQTLELKPLTVIAGPFQVRGQSHVKADVGEVSLRLDLNTKDISSLPTMFPTVPFGSWTGAITGQITASQRFGQPLELTTQVESSSLNWLADWKSEDLTLTGPVSFNGKLSYKQGQNQLPSGTFAVGVSLGSALLKYQDVLDKPPQIPLQFSAQGTLNETQVQISLARLDLATISATADGWIALAPNNLSQIKVSLAPSSLTGLERFIPSARSTPLQGTVAGALQIEGSLHDPEKFKAQVRGLKVSDLFATLAVDRKDVKIVGPLRGHLEVDASLTGDSVEAALGKLSLDLTGLQIKSTGIFQKPSAATLKLQSNIRKVESGIQLDSTALELASSQLLVSGLIRNPKRPHAQLEIQIPQVDLKQISEFYQPLAPFGLEGLAQARFKVEGTWDRALGVMKSPIQLTGALSGRIKKISTHSFLSPAIETSNQTAPENKIKDAGSSQNKKSEPNSARSFVERTPLLERLRVTYSVTIDELEHLELVGKKLNINGSVDRGAVAFTIAAGSLFGGSAELKAQAALFDGNTPVKFQTATKGLRIEQLLDWASPNWKGTVAGQLTGSLTGVAPYVLQPALLERISVQGQAEVASATLATLPLQTLISDRLKSIPGVVQSIKMPSIVPTGQISSKFSFEGGKVDFLELVNRHSDGTEVSLKGRIGLDKSMDMTGDAKLASVNVEGPFRKANSDGQGRLIVPLVLKGTLTSPSLEIVDSALKVMLQKTAEYEAKKAAAQLQQKAQDEVKKQAEEATKRIKKSAEDEAQKLLRRILGP